MTYRLPRLPMTQPPWPQFQIWWQQVVESIEAQEASQDEIIANQAAQLVLIEATQDSLAAQLVLIEAAQAGLASQLVLIEAAQNALVAQLLLIEGAQRDIARIASYPSPTNVLTAIDDGATATIAIAAHTRIYPGTVADVSISAGSITGLAFATSYVVYYDDATLADTTPAFVETTDVETAQVGAGPYRHLVGYITTPTDGGAPSAGTGPTPPGGSPDYPLS